jgi:hypothetical protein
METECQVNPLTPEHNPSTALRTSCWDLLSLPAPPSVGTGAGRQGCVGGIIVMNGICVPAASREGYRPQPISI